MQIGIIGNGTVGSAMLVAYQHLGHDVLAHDIVPERSQCSLSEVVKRELVFVCLPTPKRDDSLRCNTRSLDTLLWEIIHLQPEANVVIRSTVPIGYTKLFHDHGLSNIVHSPEFLTMRTAVEDARNPRQLIIGCPDRMKLTDGSSKLFHFYAETHEGNGVKVLICHSDASEAIKLMQNSFSAAKVSLFNEFYQLCKSTKIDWDTVVMGLLNNGWINPMHTEVPGPDGQFGYGGACFPKDIANLVTCMRDAGVSPTMLLASMERNAVDRG